METSEIEKPSAYLDIITDTRELAELLDDPSQSNDMFFVNEDMFGVSANDVKTINRSLLLFPRFQQNGFNGKLDLRINERFSIELAVNDETFERNLETQTDYTHEANQEAYADSKHYLAEEKNPEGAKVGNSFPLLLSSTDLNIEVVFISEFDGIIVSPYGIKHKMFEQDDRLISCFNRNFWSETRLPKQEKQF